MAAEGANPDASLAFMKQELSCSVCYDLLKERTELDCPHIYCLKCLQGWVGKEQTVGRPECRHVTIVPIGGVQDLKTNLRLKAMAEKYRYAECIEKQTGVPMCPIHEGERQHFYCVTCGVTVCHNCLVLKHQRPQHDIQELKDITGERKKQMNDKLRQVKAKVEEIDTYQNKLDDVENQMKTAVEMAVSDVDRRADEIIAQVDAIRIALKEKTHETSKKHLKTLRDQKSCNSDLKERLTNVQLASQNAVDTAADHVYMKQHDTLVNNMEKLCMTKHETAASDLACLHFKPTSDSVSPEWFGEVVNNDYTEQELTLVTEFGAFNALDVSPKTKAAKPRGHPSCNEMVHAAVGALKDRKGSSLTAIKKYIAANYKCDFDKLNTPIENEVKAGVANGTLVQVKGKGASGYKLFKK